MGRSVAFGATLPGEGFAIQIVRLAEVITTFAMVGASGTIDDAIGEFAMEYADHNERSQEVRPDGQASKPLPTS
jgi:hypothetical protein